MLPFLKNKQEGSMSGPVEVKDMSDGEFHMMDAIVEDMIEAVHKKDKGLLKSALEALVEHIKDMDQVQDESLTKQGS